MTFRVGQKVVCISERTGGYGTETFPLVGGIYTIRAIETGRPANVHPVGLWFEEIVNFPMHYEGYKHPTECSFSAFRFRPIVERKASISIFKRLQIGRAHV